jgi:hypothetical protein
VVAVLIGIASLMIPVIAKVSGSSKVAACANKLRQISQAGNLYRANNGSRWPRTIFSDEGKSDFSKFAQFSNTNDIFRCPASDTAVLTADADMTSVNDYIYVGQLTAIFSDNDWNQGSGGTSLPFDPSKSVVNEILSYVFGNNNFDSYVIYNSSYAWHDNSINVCFLRDGRVEIRVNDRSYEDMTKAGQVLDVLFNDSPTDGELIELKASLAIPA